MSFECNFLEGYGRYYDRSFIETVGPGRNYICTEYGDECCPDLVDSCHYRNVQCRQCRDVQIEGIRCWLKVFSTPA